MLTCENYTGTLGILNKRANLLFSYTALVRCENILNEVHVLKLGNERKKLGKIIFEHFQSTVLNKYSQEKKLFESSGLVLRVRRSF